MRACGRVERIDLAPGPKARMELSVERRFAPFRADARCSIRPEGLISENFVQCDPGSPDAVNGAFCWMFTSCWVTSPAGVLNVFIPGGFETLMPRIVAYLTASSP